jgi:gas vesicle protein GvpK/gas vesicle protein GvpA/GvpJ/GvpM family
MRAAIGTSKPLLRPAASPGHAEAAHSLAEILDRILHRGVALEGNLTISVADVDLLYLDLRVLLAAVDTIWPEGRREFRAAPRSDPPPRETPPPPPLAPPIPGNPPTPRDGAEPALSSPGSAENAAPLASGLIRLVLTLVRLLHEVLERQAVRRMSAGQLTGAQIENVGLALLAQTEELERLRRHFGFADRDLDLRLDLADRFTTGDSPCPASIR